MKLSLELGLSRIPKTINGVLRMSQRIRLMKTDRSVLTCITHVSKTTTCSLLSCKANKRTLSINQSIKTLFNEGDT